MKLTSREVRVLAALLSAAQVGKPSTYRSLMRACGWRSVNAAMAPLDSLVRKGLVSHKPGMTADFRPKCRLLLFEEFFR